MNTFSLNDATIANGARVIGAPPDASPGRILVTPQPLSTNPAVCLVLDLRGNLIARLNPYQSLTYGLNSALARWDGQSYILLAPGPGRGYTADIRVFTRDGREVSALIGGFASHGSTLAAGDWDGDGQDEVFVGAGINPDGDYRVRVLDRHSRLLSEWQAFQSK